MKKNKKGILFVIGSYYPEITGGGLQTYRLVKVLKKKFKCFILTTTKNKKILNQKNIYRINYSNNKFLKFFLVFGIFIYLFKIKNKIDVIYLRGFTTKIFIIILLGKIFGKKIIYSATRYKEDDIKTLKSRFPILIMILKLCDKNIYMSNILKQNISKKINNYYLPNFVDRLSSKKKKINKLPIIIAVGFFSKIKNTKLTYLVWKNLFLKGYKSKIIFVGKYNSDYYLQDNEIYSYIIKDAKKNCIQEYLEIKGQVKNINKYYQISDIFVLPSQTEGFSGSIIEAMSFKNASIVTNLKKIHDIYINNYNCLKIKKNSFQDYYLKLKKLITNKELRIKLSINGYNFVKSNYYINSKQNKRFIYNLFDPKYF